MAVKTPRSNRWLRVLLGVVVSMGVGALLAWALIGVMRPAKDPLESSAQTTVTVRPGSVGSTIKLDTIVAWTPVPVGTNRAAGVVTSAGIRPGTEVSPGDVLYAVDTRPVVIARGEVPAFRTIRSGVEGPDVAQLQDLLAELGYYHFRSDGKAESETVAAIREWQSASGLPPTGVIGPGDVVFVPKLPARVVLAGKIVRRGAMLTGGEDVLQALPVSPTFEIPVTVAQSNRVPLKTAVEVTSPRGDTWKGSVVGVTQHEDGSAALRVGKVDASPLCGNQCDQIPATGESSLASRIVIVKEVDGLIIPSAALDTSSSGETSVVTRSGKRIPVTVTASASGISVVEGVREGTRVVVHSNIPEQK